MSSCINHIGAITDGYGVRKHQGMAIRAHRLAYCQHRAISIRDIDNVVILHSCDNRLCINPDHLIAGTHADNCADKVRKGRQAKGQVCGNSKLKDADVKTIKSLFSTGSSNASIAKIYGVSGMCIGRIKSGATWSHL